MAEEKTSSETSSASTEPGIPEVTPIPTNPPALQPETLLRQFIRWLKETSNKPEHQQLERSYLFMRQGIGYIGIALPIVLLVGTMILG